MPTTGADRLPVGLDWIRRKFADIDRQLKEIRQLPRGGSGQKQRPSVWAVGLYTETQQKLVTNNTSGWQDINFPPFVASSPDMVSAGSGATRGAQVPRDGWYELVFTSRISNGGTATSVTMNVLGGMAAGDYYGASYFGAANISHRLRMTWWVPARAGQALRFQIDSYAVAVTLYGWMATVRWVAPLGGYSP